MLNTEWKDKIKKLHSDKNATRERLQLGLSSLLSELNASPYNLKTELKLMDNIKLQFQITIGVVTFVIQEKEINFEKDLKEELIRLIEFNFTESLK